jgi:hypothetical protein
LPNTIVLDFKQDCEDVNIFAETPDGQNRRLIAWFDGSEGHLTIPKQEDKCRLPGLKVDASNRIVVSQERK